MLKVDIEKMKGEISGTRMENMTEFAYLTIMLINQYGKEAVQSVFKIVCNENFQEDLKNV